MSHGFLSGAFKALSFFSALLFAGAAFAQPASTPPCDATDLLAGRAPAETDNITGSTAHVTDGAIGHDGAPWDSAEAVTFTGAGSLTYDLGAPRSLSAAYIQADGNDTYRLSGSLDGTPGSYRPLGEFENVRRLGHGLRGRTLRFAPASVRFLRVSEGVGDGAFSIAELAAYCSAPVPFPPAFRVEGPSGGIAPASDDASAGPMIPLEEDTNGPARLPLLLAAGVLFVFGIGTSLRRTSAKEPKRSEERRRLEREAARTAATERVLRLMFLGSGCAALIYEVIWFHLMRLVIGASALSVGIVLASFMGGMFLGSLLFPRYVPPDRHPLRVYGLLEIGVGVCGLLMPLVLPAVRSVYLGLVGYGALGIALRGVIATVLLLPPTALMGATLPAIARRYPPGRRGMSALAWLYATNTGGAVLGSLLAAFYLLALFDVWVATCAAAALNFLVGGLGVRLARTTPHALAVRSRASTAKGAAKPGKPRLERTGAGIDVRAIYVVAGLSGLTSLGAQVLWTRLLTLLFGATVFAFAIILAVFLAGLGLGSALAAYLLRRGQRAARALGWTQLLLVPALFFSGLVLARYLPFASPPNITPLLALHGLHVVRAVVVILPSAVLWGASFPFALAAAAASSADTGRSSAYVYAANTIGAIAGSLGVSFWIIPSYGSGVAGQLLAGLAGVSAAVAFQALARAATQGGRAGKGSGIEPTWALAAGALAAALVPSLSPVFLAHGRYIWWIDLHDRFPYVSEGAASTVAVHVGPDGYKNFHVAGRVEATDNPADLRTERLIGHLSGLPHPHPQSVLVVGMGGGISAGALSLYPEVKRIVICEIEPRVVGATRQFGEANYHVLDNPKVEVVFDDARHFLATTHEKFDIITSDPIHPWVRGNSILFSREYYEIVRTKLNPGGLATQWVPLYETSELAIKIQMQTFMAAFPNGTVWNTQTSGKGYDVVLVGGEAPLRLDVASIQRRIDENPRIKQSLAEVKIDNVVDLLAMYGASGSDMKNWLAGTPINRDFSLKLEYISGLALNLGEADPIYAHMVAGRTYPAFVASGSLDQELRRRVMAGGG
ncbi:MAG TPA: fused MFS/spermidine synthase [Polyangiaceae bacterium]|nr:fused MFS/spermidine synthase [Polyangiaceae bacterium]